MEFVAGQVEELENLCLYHDPNCGVEGTCQDIIDQLGSMVTQSIKICPCCGDEAVCEEPDSTIHFGYIDLEAHDNMVRASLYVEEQVEALSDWMDVVGGDTEISPLDVVTAIRDLADKLELKFKESGKEEEQR